ncbi:hypothetical protein BTB1458_1302 [Mycobacterium tuberculosis]|nr:hypothetical protein BTB1458_1302 [Mycobacterium tuberculosis]
MDEVVSICLTLAIAERTGPSIRGRHITRVPGHHNHSYP